MPGENENPKEVSEEKNQSTETPKKREPADDRNLRAATHETNEAPPQAPPHFDAAEAREKIR